MSWDPGLDRKKNAIERKKKSTLCFPTTDTTGPAAVQSRHHAFPAVMDGYSNCEQSPPLGELPA